ncbi:hypothetical protein KKC59_04575, partial [bacterium]|nr:hypothetical protein [bacterium]
YEGKVKDEIFWRTIVPGFCEGDNSLEEKMKIIEEHIDIMQNTSSTEYRLVSLTLPAFDEYYKGQDAPGLEPQKKEFLASMQQLISEIKEDSLPKNKKFWKKVLPRIAIVSKEESERRELLNKILVFIFKKGEKKEEDEVYKILANILKLHEYLSVKKIIELLDELKEVDFFNALFYVGMVSVVHESDRSNEDKEYLINEIEKEFSLKSVTITEEQKEKSVEFINTLAGLLKSDIGREYVIKILKVEKLDFRKKYQRKIICKILDLNLTDKEKYVFLEVLMDRLPLNKHDLYYKFTYSIIKLDILVEEKIKFIQEIVDKLDPDLFTGDNSRVDANGYRISKYLCSVIEISGIELSLKKEYVFENIKFVNNFVKKAIEISGTKKVTGLTLRFVFMMTYRRSSISLDKRMEIVKGLNDIPIEKVGFMDCMLQYLCSMYQSEHEHVNTMAQIIKLINGKLSLEEKNNFFMNLMAVYNKGQNETNRMNAFCCMLGLMREEYLPEKFETEKLSVSLRIYAKLWQTDMNSSRERDILKQNLSAQIKSQKEKMLACEHELDRNFMEREYIILTNFYNNLDGSNYGKQKLISYFTESALELMNTSMDEVFECMCAIGDCSGNNVSYLLLKNNLNKCSEFFFKNE